MSINAIQLIVIVLLITGGVGVRRGWAKEVITTAILLATVVFLLVGGAEFILRFFSQGLVGTASAHALSGGGPGAPTGPGTPTGPSSGYPSQTPAACFVTGAQSLANFIFFGMTWLAYWAGSKHGPPPKSGTHRIAGFVPGAINGAVIMYYIVHAGLLGRQVIVENPSPTTVSTFLPVVLVLGLLGLLGVLFVAKEGKKASS